MAERVVTPDLVAVPNGVVLHRMMMPDPVMAPRRLVSTFSVPAMDKGMVAKTHVVTLRMGYAVVASTRAWPEVRKRRRRRRHVGRRRRPMLGSGL